MYTKDDDKTGKRLLASMEESLDERLGGLSG